MTLVPINKDRPGIVYIKTKVAQMRGCKPATQVLDQVFETWVREWDGGKKKWHAAQRTKANQPHPAQQELDNTSEPGTGQPVERTERSDVMHNGVAKLSN